MTGAGGAEGSKPTISRADVEALTDTADKRNRRPVLQDVPFTGATFEDGVRFDDVLFAGTASFDRALFTGTASFANATFTGTASFANATFVGNAGFAGATFEGDVRFARAAFTGQADFGGTTWQREADLVDATFGDHAPSDDSSPFELDRSLDLAAQKKELLTDPNYRGTIWFDGARFEFLRHLGPIRAAMVVLDSAVFQNRVTIVVRAARLSAVGTEFRSGTDILAQSARIALDSAMFGAPSTLGPATRDDPRARKLTDAYDKQTIPRVLSLRGARITELALSNVDLRPCRFRGAHGLDRLRFEQVQFAEPPPDWQWARRIPIRWTRRLVIAEEVDWQATRLGVTGWADQPPERTLDSPTPHQIAAIYRGLRKGSEDHKDEPGGADFYYGEMEMRRQSRYEEPTGSSSQSPPTLTSWATRDDTRRRPYGEKPLLWLYWLVSGYGLRASRALLALAVTIAVLGAIPLDLWGFSPDRSYGRALLFSLESSISVLRAPEPSEAKLTAVGEVIQILLRLAGPLFFGLTLLALRGRVKR